MAEPQYFGMGTSSYQLGAQIPRSPLGFGQRCDGRSTRKPSIRVNGDASKRQYLIHALAPPDSAHHPPRLGCLNHLAISDAPQVGSERWRRLQVPRWPTYRYQPKEETGHGLLQTQPPARVNGEATPKVCSWVGEDRPAYTVRASKTAAVAVLNGAPAVGKPS
jgi:hypothetical protein